MSKYSVTKCSTDGCTRPAKQTSDEPYCRNCQSGLCKKKRIQRNKECKEKNAKIEEFMKPLDDLKVIQTIYNELINPRQKIWNEVLVRISKRITNDIQQKSITIDHTGDDSNDDIKVVIDDTNMFPDCVCSNTIFKLLLLMRDTNIPIIEKQKQNNKIIRDFNQRIC